MFTVEYCGYHTHNPHYDIIDRPSGSSSYLFLLVLSPMIFTFPDRPAEKAQPGACILYAPGYPQYYQAEREFFNSYVHFFCPGGSRTNIPDSRKLHFFSGKHGGYPLDPEKHLP